MSSRRRQSFEFWIFKGCHFWSPLSYFQRARIYSLFFAFVTGSQTGSEMILGESCPRHSFIYKKYVRLWNSTTVTEVLTRLINKSQPGFTNIQARLPCGCWLVGHLGFKHVLVAECRVTDWSALPCNRPYDSPRYFEIQIWFCKSFEFQRSKTNCKRSQRWI